LITSIPDMINPFIGRSIVYLKSFLWNQSHLINSHQKVMLMPGKAVAFFSLDTNSMIYKFYL